MAPPHETRILIRIGWERGRPRPRMQWKVTQKGANLGADSFLL